AWKARGDTNLGVLGVAVGESFLVSTTRVTRLQITLMTGLLLLLVLIFGINLSILITHPILNLVEASKKVKAGNLDVKVETTSKDELGLLSENVDLMIQGGREANEEIIGSYDGRLESWSRGLEENNEETKAHADRVLELMMKAS